MRRGVELMANATPFSGPTASGVSERVGRQSQRDEHVPRYSTDKRLSQSRVPKGTRDENVATRLDRGFLCSRGSPSDVTDARATSRPARLA